MLRFLIFFQLCTVIPVLREKWTKKVCFESHCIALEFTVILTMLSSYLFIIKIVQQKHINPANRLTLFLFTLTFLGVGYVLQICDTECSSMVNFTSKIIVNQFSFFLCFSLFFFIFLFYFILLLYDMRRNLLYFK